MATARQPFRLHLAPATTLALVFLLSLLGTTSISAGPSPDPAGPPAGPLLQRSLPDSMRRNVVEPDSTWRRTAAPSVFAPQNAAEGPSARVNMYSNTVEGYLAPDASVVCQVYGATLKGSGAGNADADGWLQPVYCGADIVPGDRVHVRVDVGGQMLLETDLFAPTIQAQLEPGTDRISGHLNTAYPLPSQAIVWVWSEGREIGDGLDLTVAADGTFSADFSQRFDVLAGDWAMVWLAPGSHWIGQELPALKLTVTQEDNWIAVAAARGTSFDVTVAGKATLTAQTNAEGWYESWREERWVPARPTFVPGDVVILNAGGLEKRVDTVRAISIDLDEDADRAAGTIGGTDRGGLRVWCQPWVGNSPRINAAFIPATGAYTCDFKGTGWELKKSERFAVGYMEPDSDTVIQVRAEDWNPWARASLTWDALGGWFGPGVNVDYTVTAPGGLVKATASGVTRPDGWIDDIWVDADLVPGDTVHAIASNGFDRTFVLLDVTGTVDPSADRITGQVQGLPGSGTGFVNIYGPWPDRNHGQGFTVAANGAFDIQLAPDFDVRLGDRAEIWIDNPTAAQTQTGVHIGTLSTSVNYGGEWVELTSSANVPFMITVQGKGTLSGMTDRHGQVSGWESQWDNWQPSRPAIEPGDTVVVQANGFTRTISPVGRIAATANTGNDTITGQIVAAGITEDVRVGCAVWEPSGPTIDAATALVSPDGGAYTCDFKPVQWDLQAGQYVAVWYLQPDGNKVINSFSITNRILLPLSSAGSPVSPAPYYRAKFDGPGCEWPVLDKSIFKIGCLDGEYQALMKSASQSVWTTATDMGIHPDYDLVADVRFVGPSDGMAGLITDVTNNGDFYLFAVSKSGEYTLRAVSSSGWLAVIPWTPTTRFNIGANNRLMVRRQNGNLGIYLNGQLLSNVNASRNAGQEIGVYNSATGQPNADIRWDNFAVYPVGSMP